MLKKNRIRNPQSARSQPCGPVAIVASRYNARYVDSMVRAAQRVLRAARVPRIDIIRVPGAFEIPVVAARLASGAAGEFAAVICLGVILRGETSHADHIGRAVTHALVELQIRHGVPIIHEVLLLENAAQARVRCLSPEHNRGVEAARTALAMATVLRSLG